jgi:hypothetical protein
MGRAVAAGDAQWTEEDTLLALEYTDWAAQLCPGCGHHLTQSTDPGNEGRYVTHDQVCHACAAKEQHVKDLQDNPRAVTEGRKVGVVLEADDN